MFKKINKKILNILFSILMPIVCVVSFFMIPSYNIMKDADIINIMFFIFGNIILGFISIISLQEIINDLILEPKNEIFYKYTNYINYFKYIKNIWFIPTLYLIGTILFNILYHFVPVSDLDLHGCYVVISIVLLLVYTFMYIIIPIVYVIFYFITYMFFLTFSSILKLYDYIKEKRK